MRNVRELHPRTLICVLGLVAGSLALAACGSPAPTTTTTIPSSTTTTKPHVTTHPACATALLQITTTFGGAAAGGSFYRFTATNTAPSTCALDGYPTLSFFAPNAAGGAGSGAPVTLSVTDAGSPATVVDLRHGQSAQFLLLYTDVPVNGAGCTTVASVDVRPPHETQSTPVPVSFSPCGGEVKVYAFAPPGSQNP